MLFVSYQSVTEKINLFRKNLVAFAAPSLGSVLDVYVSRYVVSVCDVWMKSSGRWRSVMMGRSSE